MNKYLRNGLIYTILGLVLCGGGYYLMEQDLKIYKWVMISGVVVFGGGFLSVVYSLMRKIERRSLESQRRERDKKG